MQALGRCIRHKFDYGAIILIDERLQSRDRQRNLSRWVRDTIACPRSFATAQRELETFFETRAAAEEEEEARAAAADSEKRCGKTSILSGLAAGSGAAGAPAAGGAAAMDAAGVSACAAAPVSTSIECQVRNIAC